MIVYANPDRLFADTNYDQTYTANPDRFSHRVTFRALDAVFDRPQFLPKPGKFLDLGCGQGPVIRHVRDVVRQRAPEAFQRCEFYGLDISRVAIDQCETHAPDIRWILDSFQEFLCRPEIDAEYRGRFRLVINKGGLTHARSTQEYRNMLTGAHSLLEDGGIYLYVQNKRFYQTWSNNTCRSWGTDIFDIAADLFGEPKVVEDPSAYVCIYEKRPAARPNLARRASKPVEVDFLFENGEHQKVFVSGDALTERRLAQLRARPDPNEPFVYAPPARKNAATRGRIRKRTRQVAEEFVPGRPRILIPGSPIRMASAAADPHSHPTGVKRIDPFPLLFRALKSEYNLIYFPDSCPLTRHYCAAVHRWGESRPDVLVLGMGLEDYRTDIETGKPVVDLDEYRYRVDWVVDTALRQVAQHVVWFATPPAESFSDARNGFRHDSAMASRYSAAAAEICRGYDVPIAELRIGDCAGGRRDLRNVLHKHIESLLATTCAA